MGIRGVEPFHSEKSKYNLQSALFIPTCAGSAKAMVFPVVTYGWEIWTKIRLSAEELMLLNCGVGEDSWESLGLQGDQTSQS